MNGDGILDSITVTGDGSFSFLEIQLGNGDGTFGLPFVVTPNAAPYAGPPVIGDFNRDGKLDIAVTGPNPIAVFLGNGDGTVQNEVDYPAANQYCVSYAAVADMNGDGNLDLITSNGSILLGNGDGTFAPATSFPVPGCANNVKIADINGDGKLDVATVSYSGNAGNQQLNLLLGKGDGTFQPPIAIAAGEFDGYLGISSVDVADFNNDGLLDFVISGGGSSQLGNSTLLLQTH